MNLIHPHTALATLPSAASALQLDDQDHDNMSSLDSSRRCRTLLQDGIKRCNTPLQCIGSELACRRHIKAYDASYAAYKKVADEANVLRKHAQLKRSDVNALSLEEVTSRIEGLRAFLDASQKELTLRKEHDKNFIGERA